MKVLTPGHQYILDNFEDKDRISEPPQTLQFIYKIPIPGTTDLETIKNGTTNEEVLAVLIDRIKFLNDKFPCRENSIALTHIETALLWLNSRTANRKARNVEGKAEK